MWKTRVTFHGGPHHRTMGVSCLCHRENTCESSSPLFSSTETHHSQAPALETVNVTGSDNLGAGIANSIGILSQFLCVCAYGGFLETMALFLLSEPRVTQIAC